jgi:hypothetical protein
VCNNNVGMTPYATGGTFGGFQSTPGSSFQTTITVTFAIAVNSVSVTILDPDFGGNAMEAYDSGGTLLGRVSFVGDEAPGTFSMDTRSISATGIARVLLIPDPSDYVAYSNVTFAGCF